MLWQDLAMSVGLIVFSIALIPSILGKNKPDFWTAAITLSTLILLFLPAQLSLGLVFSAVGTLIQTLCWSILAYQVKCNA